MSYKLVHSQVLNQDYRGHAEQCDYTFTVNLPDQLGVRWRALQHLQAHIEKLQEQGSKILEYYLWEDRAPVLTTNYYTRIVASASPLWWNLLILGVIALLALLVTVWAIRVVKDILDYLGGAGGEKLSQTAIAIAIIAAVTVAGIYLVRKPKRRE